jgi:succinate dehydrogenase / fumarate reductase membrane anchor subunit
MTAKDTRSSLARAAGLGSAHTGVGHWWGQRVTAAALVPLSLWFTASVLAVAGGGYAAVREWLQAPVSALLAVLTLAALFHHLALGLQVIVEDYVHASRAKFPALLAVRLGCGALAAAGALAVLRIALGG